MTLFIQQVLNGIGAGVVYASLALALVLIYRTTGLLNFAQGEMALLSTYAIWKLSDAELPIWAAIGIVFVASCVVGALIELVVIRPVEDKSALTVVIVTIGMFLALNSLAQFWFGTDAKTVTKPFSQTVWDIGEVRLEARILGLAVLLVVECLVLFVLLQRTKLGLALRAVSANVESSRLVGINTGVVLMAGWAAAAGLGALGGVAAISSQDLDASLMQRLLVFAFAATALGGFDSPLGAVVGGLVVGIADSLTKEYLDVVAGHTILQGIELVVPFALIATVLLVRPTGLFGRRVVERV